MAQSTWRTTRIQLVPWSDDHVDSEVELDADPEAMRYLGRPRQRVEVEQAYRRKVGAASTVPGSASGLVEGSFVAWWILLPPERADQPPVRDRRNWATGCCAGIGVGA